MADGVGTTHHVKIGDQYYLIRPGSYRKQGAPQFGARFATGDPDYNRLNMWQYWVQRCWVGGMGAETWMDDSMYDESRGVDTTQHEVMALSRDLTRYLVTGVLEGREYVEFNSKLYCLAWGAVTGAGTARLYRLNTDLTWTNVHTFTYECRSVAVFNGKLFIGDGGGTVTYMNTDETFTNFARAAGIPTSVPDAMCVYRDRLYIAYDREIWRLKRDTSAGSGFSFDGSTEFYNASGADYIDDMEIHLGFLYMSSRNGAIYRTDGNNTFDLWKFDNGISVIDLCSFDGRLFVSSMEPLVGTGAAQGVLYQLSGSSVTELKRWGRVGFDVTTGRMRVFGGKLWFGAPSILGVDSGSGSGFGIACYDPREDSYHVFAANHDFTTYGSGTEGGNWVIDDVYYFKGYLHASVRGHGLFATKVSYKDLSRYQAVYDTTTAGASVGSGNGGWIVSSDFDAGTPGLLKLWDSVTIHVDLPSTATSVYVDVSTDGGLTYANIGSVTKSGSATRYAKTLKLVDGSAAMTGTRLKWRLWLRTTDETRSPQVRGVVVAYLPIPEPNWKWEMTLVLNDRQQLLDGTLQDASTAAKLAALEAAFRAQVPVHFTEPDGTAWGASDAKQALITDLRENIRYIGPSSDGGLEGEVEITIVEIKDEYEALS